MVGSPNDVASGATRRRRRRATSAPCVTACCPSSGRGRPGEVSAREWQLFVDRLAGLPPVDEVTRDRAATADEAEALLEPLDSGDRVPFALAVYAGLPRSEMDRLEWEDVAC